MTKMAATRTVKVKPLTAGIIGLTALGIGAAMFAASKRTPSSSAGPAPKAA